jgi:hypothetical protein
MDVLEAMKKEMFRRRLSPRTMQAYLFYVRKFLWFCGKHPKEFSRKDCRLWIQLSVPPGIVVVLLLPEWKLDLLYLGNGVYVVHLDLRG